MDAHHDTADLPGTHLDLSRIPGHWLLARMGKRVLRPGGLELTRQMLEGLGITPSDHVVELAPGLGTTTRIVLQHDPATYVGVERDEGAVRSTRSVLRSGRDECRRGNASSTGLDDAAATVIFGEAMLTMQTARQKDAIIREAHRVLKAGGRYAIHELALAPDDLPEIEKDEIAKALSDVIRVGARPLTVSEWRQLLESGGFTVEVTKIAPMHLLEPARIIADEGLAGTLKIALNVLRQPAARRRIAAMRAVFNRYESKMCAVAIVARKVA
jgi:ubiquinone/menaquinone biosynthesis C-methylase UbiE